MQTDLDRIDAALAELAAATASFKAKLGLKEAALVSARKGADVLETHTLAMQKQMPRMKESCDALKDV